MSQIIYILFFVIINCLTYSFAVTNPKVVCYYESWGYWREGNGKMTVNDIDTSLCTHIVYAYLGITDSFTVSILDPYLMEDTPNLNDLSNFVKKKGSAKALISIGGSSQSSKFTSVAASDAARTTFVNSVVALLTKYHFDGVMIDWQFPGEADRDNYIKLLDKFDEKFVGTSFSLGVTVPALKEQVEHGFDVKKLVHYVDIINVLTIDLHGPWDSNVNYAAPLSWQLDALEYWWQMGAPKNKLIMAIPFFARTWKLSKVENNELTALGAGGGTPGPYTKTAGLLSYNELCSMMRAHPSDFIIRRDTKTPAVYAVHGNDWITYEDSQTTQEKAKQATAQGYGGVVTYALTNDDFRGECGTKFVLLNGVNKGLDRTDVAVGTPPPITTIAPPTVPTAATVPTVPDDVFRCTKAGNFRDKIYCRKYYHCSLNDMGLWEQNILTCDVNLAFDETANKCNNKEVVPGCNV